MIFFFFLKIKTLLSTFHTKLNLRCMWLKIYRYKILLVLKFFP